MAVSKDTFSAAGGAVSDIFAGFGALAKGQMQAKGLEITAQGTRLNASSLRIKAQGDIAEADNYDLAAGLARENAAYTVDSTRMQQMQLDRQITHTLGSQAAGVAASGFSAGGSAGDLLRDSASQGSLAKDVLAKQGLITEAGYNEQASSFDTMSKANRTAAAGEYDIATKTDDIAKQQDQLATDTRRASEFEATGDFIGSAFKAAASVATLFA